MTADQRAQRTKEVYSQAADAYPGRPGVALAYARHVIAAEGLDKPSYEEDYEAVEKILKTLREGWEDTNTCIDAIIKHFRAPS